MTDELQLLRDARPTTKGPDSALRDNRREDLLATVRRADRDRRRGRRPFVALIAAALAAVGVAFIVSSGSRSDDAWAAALVRVAEESPRLMIAAPGWRVSRVDEFNGATGEMTFSNGSRQIELRWQPVDAYASTVADRAASADVAVRATVLDVAARLFRYTGTDDFTALWATGAHAVELRANAGDMRAFRALLGSVVKVDVDTWLAALPGNVVIPTDRGQVVAEMLADVPTPRTFERSKLEHSNTVRDRYQLGALVTGAVACAWIEQWIEAKRIGDAPAATEAVAAMATSRQWRVLRQMERDGGYSRAIREYADAIASDGTVVGGKVLTVEESYRNALGCL